MHHFFIIGGDQRQLWLSRLLREKGFSTVTNSLPGSGEVSLKEGMDCCDMILGPVPFSKDGRNLFCQEGREEIPIESLLPLLTKNHTLFGGNLPGSVTGHCFREGIDFCDFMKLEEVAQKNGALTAEGAIAEAICLSPGAIHHSACLVLGFGRCGQPLAQKLSGLSGQVTVADQSEAQLALAWARGFHPVPLSEVQDVLPDFDYIFNTIPAPVISASAAKGLKKSAAVLDLASAPGGVDLAACRKLGVSAKLCPSLPGRYCPRAAAEILLDIILQK